MLLTAKNLVTNEDMQPIAVQIDYADWLKIEALLEQYTQKQIEPPHNITVWQTKILMIVILTRYTFMEFEYE